ncbi:MAG: 30S ribosomal protein S12 methylthiotransferase RimO [Lachnospiraceae bacterium]|nr:30S ribosomal protein S12 methylthiotransferase RimO [Lachnospiraceae bacterium]
MRVLFISLGCDKNLVDSEEMLGLLLAHGYSFTDDAAEADVIVVNTCCFINDAKDESIQTILEMTEYRKSGSCKALLVTGCMAQRYRQEILDELPEVDAVLGTTTYEKIIPAIEKALSGERSMEVGPLPGVKKGSGCPTSMEECGQDTLGIAVDERLQDAPDRTADGHSQNMPEIADVGRTQNAPNMTDDGDGCLHHAPDVRGKRVVTTGGHYAYLKIAEGCDKHCTYCIIPKLRGSYRSVPMEQLVAQAENLAAQGVKELILVAQETTVYGVDLYGYKCLHLLLEALCKIEGLRWIRILYCYPEEIYDELIETIRREPKICHYLDLPIQHASDAVLKRMGRRTTRADLTAMIEKLRERIPDIVLRTTLIAGFPGESGEQHEEAMDFIDEIEFDHLGVFAYSQEEDTPAASMPDQIAEKTKQHWRDELMELQQEIAFDRAEGMVGRTVIAMIEGELPEEEDCQVPEFRQESDSAEAPGQSEADGQSDMEAVRQPLENPSAVIKRVGAYHVYVARTYGDAPDVDGLLFIRTPETLMSGDFARVRITGAREYDLIGEIADEFTE